MISSSQSKYVQLLVAAVGLFGALVCVVILGYVHNVRFDLSPGARFTLSDHARRVLRDLEEPVRVTGFIRTQDARNVVLKDLLWQAAQETTMLTYDIVDVNRNPQLAAQYGVDAYGAAVVETDNRRAEFSTPRETQLISAILHATQPPKRLYALTGHGECDLNSSDRHSGCSTMRSALLTEFYDVFDLHLTGVRTVPDDADVLLIPGPTAELVAAELDALRAYLDRGGKLLVMVDPYQASSLTTMLREYGVVYGDDVVLDPDNRLAGGEAFSAVIQEVSRQQPVTQRLDAPVLLSGTRSVRGVKDEDRRRDRVWLLRTGERSWASHDPEVLRGRRATFVAGRDLNGPLDVGVEVYQPAADVSADEPATTRIIAIGDSDLVTNRFFDYLANRDLLLNAVNWLAREERLIATRAKAKRPGYKFFFVSDEQQRGLFMAAVVVQPAIFIALGIAVFVRRRLRP